MAVPFRVPAANQLPLFITIPSASSSLTLTNFHLHHIYESYVVVPASASFYQYVHHPFYIHVRTISVRQTPALPPKHQKCFPTHVLVLSIHTTPIRKINTVIFAASCSASCLFLSTPVRKPCKNAGQTTR